MTRPSSSADLFFAQLLAAPRRWLIPALVVAGAGCLYAAFGPATWEASQALIVRNEAAANQGAPGKFSHVDEMKTVQETILELARSRGLLEAALSKVAPPGQRERPAADEVAELRTNVKLTPPKGAEFGKTEVFYLKVRDRNRARALSLNDAICEQLQARFQELRDAKAQSMIDELAKAAGLAKADLADSTARLNRLERQVGANLAELRVLQETSSGESALRRTYTEVCNELRQAESAEQSDRELLAVLHQAQADPARLLATPNRLLESQPALRRLKDGLVDSQLRSAQFEGRMAQAHPLVQAAKQSEKAVADQLHNELALAVRGLEVDLRVHGERLRLLRARLAGVIGQMNDLAAVRADYANLVAEAKNRETLLERAEQNLADARASQASAKAASLIGRIDTADTGADPVGPGAVVLAMGGILGGLLVGLGFLVLTTLPAPEGAESPRPTLFRPTLAPEGVLSLNRSGTRRHAPQ